MSKRLQVLLEEDELREIQDTALEVSSPILQELTYFALGADQPNGLDLLETVYVSARNRHQLGVCEQYLSKIRILEPVLSSEASQVLRYFQADLSLAYYQLDEAEEQAEAETEPESAG